MNVSEGLSFVLKVRRLVVTVSVLAGAASGYKFGPSMWHKASDKINTMTGGKATASVTPSGATKPVFDGTVTTNSAGVKLANCDLGTITLTNHYETCVPLGAGKDCVLTPNVIDSHNVQLTVTVESRTNKGKIHDLSVTQVVAKSGKPFAVAVGSYSFSLTPNVSAQ